MINSFSNNILSVSFEIFRVLACIDKLFGLFMFQQKRPLNLIHLIHVDIYWWFRSNWVILDAPKERSWAFTTAHAMIMAIIDSNVWILCQKFFSLFRMRSMNVLNNLSWDRCWSKGNPRIVNPFLHPTRKITWKVELIAVDV